MKRTVTKPVHTRFTRRCRWCSTGDHKFCNGQIFGAGTCWCSCSWSLDSFFRRHDATSRTRLSARGTWKPRPKTVTLTQITIHGTPAPKRRLFRK